MFTNNYSKYCLVLREKINLLALALCGLSSCFWMIYVAQWYYFRYTGGWDTAYFIQTLWSISHGSFSSSVLGANNFMADHCHFLSFLLAPLHGLFPDPLFLQYIKIWAFFTGTYIFFLILKKMVDPWVALGGMIAFSIAPANIAMLRFAFSYEALTIPLVFLIFKSLEEKKYLTFLISCIFLMMVKEQMPLVVMFFGLAVLIFEKKDKFKWGGIPFLIGSAVFILEIFVLLPYLRDALHIKPLYWSRYAQFGRTPEQICWFLLTHPGKVWAQCVSPLNIRWYGDLFGVWGGFGFFSPQILFPALPLFLKMALSSEPVEHSVTVAYYACVFTPFVFLATWKTLTYIPKEWKPTLQGIVLAFMFVHSLNYVPLWTKDIPHYPTTNLLAIRKFIDDIPSKASVLSCRKAMPYLADRRRLYQLKDYINGVYYISALKFVLPEDLDYILIDFSEIDYKRKSLLKMAALNFDPRFSVKESIEDVVLLERHTLTQKPPHHLIETSFQPFLTEKGKGEGIALGKNITLEAVAFPKEFPSSCHIFPVTMFWHSMMGPKGQYEVSFKIIKRKKVLYEKRRIIGSTIHPTTLWKENEYIKEEYYYLLPQLPKDKYWMEIQIYTPQTKIKSRIFRQNITIR